MKRFYKIIRTLTVSILLLLAGLYAIIYIALLLPPVQNLIARTAEKELSALTGGKVTIGHVSISPFNEVIVSDLSVDSPTGEHVLDADKIGAGLSLRKLIYDRRIVFTYAEIIGLDGNISQEKEGAPLNIQFLIDAFKSKDKNKPPTHFDLVINNIILRQCNISFDRKWKPASARKDKIDFNHLRVTDLAADLRLPVLRNDDFEIDLRRLAFNERSGLQVDKISGIFHISTSELSFKDLTIQLPGTGIAPADMTFAINGLENLKEQILAKPITLILPRCYIKPRDFACFLPILSHYDRTIVLTADVTYSTDNLNIGRLDLISDPDIALSLKGEVTGLQDIPRQLEVSLPAISLYAKANAVNNLLTDFITLKPEIADLLRRCGDISLDGDIAGSMNDAHFIGTLKVAQGGLEINADYKKGKDGAHQLRAALDIPDFNLGSLLDKADFGSLSAIIDADLSINGNDADGHAALQLNSFGFKGYTYSDIIADITKHGKEVEAEIHSGDPNLDFDIQGHGLLAGPSSALQLDADIRNFRPVALNLGDKVPDISLSGLIAADITGNDANNLDGYVEVTDFHYDDTSGHDIDLGHLRIEAQRRELPYYLTIDSEILTADIRGDYRPLDILPSLKTIAARFMPDLIGAPPTHGVSPQQFDFAIHLPKDSPLLSRVKLPVSLLQDLDITGSYNSLAGTAELDIDIPYLRQGASKLIRDTRLALRVDTAENICNLALSTRIPNNKGDISLSLDANAANDRVQTDISWLFDLKSAYKGLISLTGRFPKDAETHGRDILVDINPSQFQVNDTVWTIDAARLKYSDKSVEADSIRVHRPGQFALINGKANASDEDHLHIDLQDIDLDYVFETLNINYVTFGGSASGTLSASRIFTPTPVLTTEKLQVKDLTYNHSVLGDALIDSHFDTQKKSVFLDAHISERQTEVARVYGNIYVVGDSLNLRCEADKVNVGFMQPFMAAFCSEVEGHASGKVNLYGTFKDIDLTGKVYADSLRMKIDVTNTWYSASDTVVMQPGRIILDNITLHDRNDHTALLNGEVRHRYFHDPSFDFTITDAKEFLCYDTNSSINPVWYGTIYGSGSGSLHGVPGFIDVMVDMTSDPGSTFTFVLADTEEAMDYQFITFTDKRKAALEAAIKEEIKLKEEEPEFLKEFRKKEAEKTVEIPTRYSMDIRMTATPEADLTIVMDPIAGDKIKANGAGNLRMSYNSDGELELYGTYTLSRGTYNFTLQDLIVRDFKIRDGSKITFNGDPLAAILDITAAYRVNTSLTDLDKSFAYDRDLNRTNVPVEALLKVSGNMQSPDINFDIELPTLTSDVESKVKSIVSTADMMNRQIIYLLALNRFYTPDYMNTSGNNNELASVASTTLSTQLSSMLGALSPNWNFSPYFRTDKGDFSDMEVDLALSSSLFNNRLLLNGNVGYRDRTTSSTTFVGDFDLEYLLNPSGTLRLKAYNHFNDQNYYLRSALTTQGIGIVFKRDFNRFLPGLFRRHKKQEAATDTIPD